MEKKQTTFLNKTTSAYDLLKYLGSQSDFSLKLPIDIEGIIKYLNIKLSKNPNFKKYIVNGLIKQIKKLEVDNLKIPQNDTEFDALTIDILNSYTELEQKATLLVLIRNKFAHNQLPNKEVYDFCQIIQKRLENQTYASYYLALFKKLKKEI